MLRLEAADRWPRSASARTSLVVARATSGLTGRRGGLRRGPRRRPAPHRLPARARPRADLPGQGLPRRGRRARRAARRTRSSSARRRARSPSSRASAPKTAAGGRAGRWPGGCRTTSPSSRPAADGPVTAGGAALRAAAARRPAHPLGLVRRRQPDRGDGPDRPRPRPRVRRAHRPLAAADRGQRAVARAAAPTSSTSSPSSTSELAPFRHPHRHRGRHPRRRLARPGADELLGRLDVVVASRALQAADGRRRDDPPDGDRGRQPAHRRPRALHRPAGHRRPRDPAPSRRSTPSWCSRPAGSSASPSRSTAGRSGSTRRGGCSGWRSRPGCLFSIDTDAHAPGQLDWQPYGCARAEECGVPAERVRQHPVGRGPAGLDRRHADGSMTGAR